MNKLVQQAIASNIDKNSIDKKLIDNSIKKPDSNYNEPNRSNNKINNRSRLSGKSVAKCAISESISLSNSVPENLVYYSSKLVDNSNPNSNALNINSLNPFKSSKFLRNYSSGSNDILKNEVISLKKSIQNRYNVVMPFNNNNFASNIMLPNRSPLSLNSSHLKQSIKASIKSNQSLNERPSKFYFDQDHKIRISLDSNRDTEYKFYKQDMHQEKSLRHYVLEEHKKNLPPIVKYKFINPKHRTAPGRTWSNNSIATSTNSGYSNVSVSNSSGSSGERKAKAISDQNFKEQIDKMKSISLTRIQKLNENDSLTVFNDDPCHTDNFSLFSSDIKSDFLNNDISDHDACDLYINKESRLDTYIDQNNIV